MNRKVLLADNKYYPIFLDEQGEGGDRDMKGKITDVLKTIAYRYLYTDSLNERDAIIVELRDFISVLESEDDFRLRSDYKVAKNIIETLRYDQKDVTEQGAKRILEDRFDPEQLGQIIDKLKADKLL